LLYSCQDGRDYFKVCPDVRSGWDNKVGYQELFFKQLFYWCNTMYPDLEIVIDVTGSIKHIKKK
jgi:hypothetical protein